MNSHISFSVDTPQQSAPNPAKAARQAMLEGRYQQALAHFDEALRQQPDAFALQAHRAETKRLSGQYHEALIDFDLALAAKPEYAWALSRRGETRRQLHELDAALTDLTASLAIDAQNYWTLAHRGAVWIALGRFEEALVDLNAALALKADYAWAMIWRANVFSYLKCFHAALADVDMARRIDPYIFPNWRGERGLVFNAMGDFESSISCCRKGLEEDSEDYFSGYSLMVALTRLEGLTASRSDIDHWLHLLHQKRNDDFHATTYRIAGLNALLGRRDMAIQLLGETMPHHAESRELARHDPAFVDLKSHPRWQGLYAYRESS